MDSREDILARVRIGRARSAASIDAPAPLSRQGLRPRVPGDLAAAFKARSEALASTVAVVATWAEVPAAVARYLDGLSLPRSAVGWPLIRGHDWAAAGIAFEARGAVDADRVGITGCHCAIAETGTLMLLSGPDTPASVSLLPETHVAVLAASRIVAGMEEAWTVAREESGALPRSVNFISGPSRTGDIEQTIVLGAHGPYRVHVVLVSGA